MQEKTNKKRQLGLCTRAFTAPQFNFDGTLLLCCILFNENYGANILKLGYENVLNTAEMQYSIRMIRGEMPPDDSNPCTRCNEYNSICYNDSYFN